MQQGAFNPNIKLSRKLKNVVHTSICDGNCLTQSVMEIVGNSYCWEITCTDLFVSQQKKLLVSLGNITYDLPHMT